MYFQVYFPYKIRLSLSILVQSWWVFLLYDYALVILYGCQWLKVNTALEICEFGGWTQKEKKDQKASKAKQGKAERVHRLNEHSHTCFYLHISRLYFSCVSLFFSCFT